MVGAIFLLSLAVMVGIGTLGLRFWVRPREAMERVAGLGMAGPEAPPPHPSLAFRDILLKLGKYVPQSPKDVSVMQRRLIRAGYRKPNALMIFYGAKLFCALVFPLITSYFILSADTDSSNKVLGLAASVGLGFFGPNEFVNFQARRRQKQIRRGLPNALDLMVVCVESGLGLDQAILQVAKELEHAHPEISEEFALVNYELKAGKRRAEALRNMAERTAVDDLKKLVAVLIQADRFGTGIAQSLRAHADYMRVQARQIAEEKAAKLGVKLVFPIFFCILPTLFVVTVGPVVVKIIRELIPMMNNI
ncbi:MAG: type II secretion system F family protein [Bryobacteraceae bacterium]|nr:type II secretion system F family protein [Bryobacteraceae bacterium]MDW8378560.1 type II secretion system F family protein [Bryobacterales bacterium]